MMSGRAKQKAIWGPKEDAISPISKFFLKNFTYELEKRNYSTRPYPITGTAFEEVPFAAALITPLSNLIKPPKLMHVEDWAIAGKAGATELMNYNDSLESSPATEV